MLTVKDRSEYLRGLLILSKLDQDVSADEKNMLNKLSNILGFDPAFVKQAVDEISENSYVSEKPPVFSNRRIGYFFIDDSLYLAFSDHNFHSNELRWIRNAAQINGIEKDYWFSQIAKYKTHITNDRLIGFSGIKQLLEDEG